MKNTLLLIVLATLTTLPLSAQAGPGDRRAARLEARQKIRAARKERHEKVHAAREEARTEIREARKEAHDAAHEEVREPAAAPAAH